jgi:hypothetical protein
VGTVFKLTPPASPGGDWTKTILHQFGQGELHGPSSPVILHNGNIYGTTTSPNGGFAFELQPPASPGGGWTANFLHEFTGGEMPGGALAMDGIGALYGATQIPTRSARKVRSTRLRQNSCPLGWSPTADSKQKGLTQLAASGRKILRAVARTCDPADQT